MCTVCCLQVLVPFKLMTLWVTCIQRHSNMYEECSFHRVKRCHDAFVKGQVAGDQYLWNEIAQYYNAYTTEYCGQESPGPSRSSRKWHRGGQKGEEDGRLPWTLTPLGPSCSTASMPRCWLILKVWAPWYRMGQG